MNFSCPICLDLFEGNDIYATPCGHAFHSECILKWIDSSKACPECRKNLTRNNVMKLYFNTTQNDTLPPIATLKNDLDAKDAEMKSKDRELSLARAEIEDLQNEDVVKERYINFAKCSVFYFLDELENSETSNSNLKQDILNLKHENRELVYQLGVKNTKIKKLRDSEKHLKHLLKTSSSSARPANWPSSGKKGFLRESKDSIVDRQWTPTHVLNCRPSTSTKADEDLTTISIPFTKKRKRLNQVVVNKDASPTFSNENSFSIAKPVPSTLKRKIDQEKDFSTLRIYNGLTADGDAVLEKDNEKIDQVEDLATLCRYNGLSGHLPVVLEERPRRNTTTKPAKKNTYIKRR